MHRFLGIFILLSTCSFVATHDICDPDDVKCLLEHDKRNITLVRVLSGQNATLPCYALTSNKNVQKAEWWFGRRSKLIGTWMGGDYKLNPDHYTVLANASLLVVSVEQNLVEEYECLVYHADKSNSSSFVLLRLDFSFFYDGPVFSTVFWGSCLMALIFCVSSFVLNIVWVGVRKLSLWLIDRSERLNRVRSMLEAMEKYRTKQMDNLHENYQRKVNAIRENYHQQVDEIRTSYSRQADRLREYKQAQVETVTQHLDHIRDNYNQQLNRIKDYGSRRADRLVESYERQLNRMRTFTLQYRLKLMRQYRIKQSHINRLLENISKNGGQQHENKDIREMLGLKEPSFPRSNFSAPVSFYSLPDLTSLDAYFTTNHAARRLSPIDFKQFRYSLDINMDPRTSTNAITSTSKITNDIDPEIQVSSNTPLLGHHRRKSSSMRTVSSFIDYRDS